MIPSSHCFSITILIMYIFCMFLTCHYTHVLLSIITVALVQIYYKTGYNHMTTVYYLIINLYTCKGGRLNSTLECLFVCLLDIMLFSYLILFCLILSYLQLTCYNFSSNSTKIQTASADKVQQINK